MSSKLKVFVGMSGGVDSSVTVALLKERGFDVHGVHIKMWSPMESLRDSTGQADPFFSVCKQQHQDRIDAMKVAAVLDIPFKVWDFTKEYKKEVVDYMIKEYKAGRTPNPDVMCNRHIKFGVFLKKALAAGADYIATGHYVRLENCNIENSLKIENCKLKIAKDTNKDQSYFLWTLTQKQLQHCLFPIGEFTKPEVRKMAKKLGLPTADKKDSQGICFIGEINLNDFLKKHILTRPGLVRSTSGKVVGKHEGLNFYTIGQRHGFGGGGGIPFYVVRKDFKKNILIVAEGPYDEKLFGKKMAVKGVNWISGNPPAGGPKLPFRCDARIRYRQLLQKCTVTCHMSHVTCNFDNPQRAITPGQSIVFYKGKEMIGGGIIEN